ncbi:hypothetical protein C8T65DRAFT_657280 [Cerioporus squamosus]|nr:hypothetical protein C8T65DRAFT_657280 [Cerioporus squamosus]
MSSPSQRKCYEVLRNRGCNCGRAAPRSPECIHAARDAREMLEGSIKRTAGGPGARHERAPPGCQ